MTIRDLTEVLVGNGASTRAAPTARRLVPNLLTETDLDRVAAANSKPGGTTDGRGPLQIPGKNL
ncbi:MAG: hypothetical protein U1E61_05435 [Bradyrhizobium sp.]